MTASETTSPISEPPTLETERLILRPFRLEDAPEFERLIAPFEVTDGTLSFPHPVPEGWGMERINKMFQTFASGEHAAFAITSCQTEALLGGIGLSITARHRRGHLGYWLGVDHWGRGTPQKLLEPYCVTAFQRLDCTASRPRITHATRPVGVSSRKSACNARVCYAITI